jgi:hypothetical protein
MVIVVSDDGTPPPRRADAAMKITSEIQAYNALRLAQLHEDEGMLHSSAKLCVKDATDLFNAGDWAFAREAAARSLSYSVGVFHADYVQVVQ